jgi:MYXO-CTERM domain-containing protein
MRIRTEKRIAGNILAILLSTIALLFIYNGSADAFPNYFNGAPGNCTACHPASPTTCDGCHAHGVHSGSAKNDLNLTAVTDQTDYAPGATVTVTLDGGYRGGWIRANLYDNTGTLVDTSTGTGGLGGGSGFPVDLTAPAPATPGTYTFTAAWYGNRFDLGQVGGTTFFGPDWTPDPNNANHGEERIPTNSFTVTAAIDNTPPTVLSTVPAANATNVAVNVAVMAMFSEPIDTATVDNTSFFLNDGVSNVAGTFSFVDNTATFTPSADLATGTVYTATLTTAVTDVAGNPLAANTVWSFTTGGGPDVTPPTVLSTSPVDNATNVAANAVVTATFDEAIAPATVDNTSFFLSNGIDNVAGTRAVVDNTIRFTPTTALSDNTTYTATVTTAVTDLAGNPLASNRVWTFRTAPAAPPPPPSSDSNNGIFGCAVAPSGGGTSGILGTYGFLMLVALGAALRRRVKRDRG